jgi:hypothetical protein
MQYSRLCPKAYAAIHGLYLVRSLTSLGLDLSAGYRHLEEIAASEDSRKNIRPWKNISRNY